MTTSPSLMDVKAGTGQQQQYQSHEQSLGEDRNTEYPKPRLDAPPEKWQKYLRMQRVGVPNEGIVQLARIQGQVDGHDEWELKRLLGMDVSDGDTRKAIGSTASSKQSFQRFLKMKQLGVRKEAILQKARMEGVDCPKLEELLDSSNGSDSDAEKLPRELCSKYIKMRMKGISIPFVLEAASNQGISKPQLSELEAILAEVDPTKTTRNVIATFKPSKKSSSVMNEHPIVLKQLQSENLGPPFTVLKKGKSPDKGLESDIEEDEKVAFHASRTSLLASLVRKMAHTVEKMSRKAHGNKSNPSNGNSPSKNNIQDDDMVIESKTLYQALGSFQGVRFARDSYNETLEAANLLTPQTSIGWFLAKRKSFREIARTIGLKLDSSGDAKVDIPGLDALIAYIEERYKESIQDSLSLLQNDKLFDFESLPALYVPGSRVVAKNVASGGVDMICRVAWNRVKSGKAITGKIRKYFEVCLEFVVAVGTNQATIAETVEGINEFEGRRNVFDNSLTFIPWMAYVKEEQTAMLERYRQRGRIYNEVALNYHKSADDDEIRETSNCSERSAYSYKAYRKGCFFVKRGGFGGTVNPSSAARGMATGGRIVIDSQGAADYGNSLNVGYDPMITGIHYKLKEYKLHQSRSSSVGATSRQHSTVDIHNLFQGANEDSNGMLLFNVIPEDFLEMVWPCVVGFSLTAKAWGDCLVDGLEDIKFSEDAFDRLVLPPSRKRLIKGLVKHSSCRHEGTEKSAHQQNFQDLIEGKGEGTVFLLHGPPGVGKTLTAEAVSEVLQRPLYSLSMGTLGTTADDLERRLTEILKLTAKWKAILLLDEADSFLESRSSSSSLERNAIVSVMLQMIEYFSGILFLTSNRMDSLDPAFLTRITLCLEYENLTSGGRQKVWENLLLKSGVQNLQGNTCKNQNQAASTLRLIVTDELAKFPLNGREIKNALRLALALAKEEKSDVSHELLIETSSMVKPVSSSGYLNDKRNPLLKRTIFILYEDTVRLLWAAMILICIYQVFLHYLRVSPCDDIKDEAKDLFGRFTNVLK